MSTEEAPKSKRSWNKKLIETREKILKEESTFGISTQFTSFPFRPYKPQFCFFPSISQADLKWFLDSKDQISNQMKSLKLSILKMLTNDSFENPAETFFQAVKEVGFHEFDIERCISIEEKYDSFKVTGGLVSTLIDFGILYFEKFLGHGEKLENPVADLLKDLKDQTEKLWKPIKAIKTIYGDPRDLERLQDDAHDISYYLALYQINPKALDECLKLYESHRNERSQWMKKYQSDLLSAFQVHCSAPKEFREIFSDRDALELWRSLPIEGRLLIRRRVEAIHKDKALDLTGLPNFVSINGKVLQLPTELGRGIIIALLRDYFLGGNGKTNDELLIGERGDSTDVRGRLKQALSKSGLKQDDVLFTKGRSGYYQLNLPY